MYENTCDQLSVDLGIISHILRELLSYSHCRIHKQNGYLLTLH